MLRLKPPLCIFRIFAIFVQFQDKTRHSVSEFETNLSMQRHAPDKQMQTDMCAYLWKTEDTMRRQNWLSDEPSHRWRSSKGFWLGVRSSRLGILSGFEECGLCHYNIKKQHKVIRGLWDKTDKRSLTSSSSSPRRFNDRRDLKPLHFCYPCNLNLKFCFSSFPTLNYSYKPRLPTLAPSDTYAGNTFDPRSKLCSKLSSCSFGCAQCQLLFV